MCILSKHARVVPALVSPIRHLNHQFNAPQPPDKYFLSSAPLQSPNQPCGTLQNWRLSMFSDQNGHALNHHYGFCGVLGSGQLARMCKSFHEESLELPSEALADGDPLEEKRADNILFEKTRLVVAQNLN